MARKALHIVASDGVKQVLGSLGSPLIQVAVQGRVTTGPGGNSLLIERITTAKSTTLPIVASQATKKALGAAAESSGSHEVTLLGRVVQNISGNVLVLDQVNRATRLPISADEDTREMLADLAANGGDPVTVKASVIEQGGNKVLVLAGEECECEKE